MMTKYQKNDLNSLTSFLLSLGAIIPIEQVPYIVTMQVNKKFITFNKYKISINKIV